jgi:hypothetical protein
LSSITITRAPSALGLPWQNIDPLVIGLPISAITLAVVWWVDKRHMADEETRSNGKIKAPE